ncbi:MAG: hypothetical protein ABSA53_33200 [Streptosporangiaceae bacterium]|jgi:hypothetical protein
MPATTAPPGPPPPDDLTARIFRAQYTRSGLHILPGTCLALPTGAPLSAGPGFGVIARQVSACGDPCQLPPGTPRASAEGRPGR